MGNDYLVNDDPIACDQTNSDTTEEDDGENVDGHFDIVKNGNIDLEAIMVRTAHSGNSKVINDSCLDKVWKIDIKRQKKPLVLLTKTVSAPKIRLNRKTLAQITGCCNINVSLKKNSWTPCFTLRALINCSEVTNADKYSSQTRDFYMFFLLSQRLRYYRLFISFLKRLEILSRSYASWRKADIKTTQEILQ